MRIENQKIRCPDSGMTEHEIEPFSDLEFRGLIHDEECHKIQQRRIIDPDERFGLDCTQAYILNLSFPTTLDGLLDFSDGLSMMDSLLQFEINEWTAPRWAKGGDIVFFMHAKTARTIITGLRTELTAQKDLYSEGDYQNMMAEINHGLETHATYGGKIFAVGRVCSSPEYSDEYSPGEVHWDSRCYAEVDNILILERPVDISEFNSFITVTRGGAITPVCGDDFNRLRDVLSHKNKLPWYLLEAKSKPFPLRGINRKNWIPVSHDYRRTFILERQFRSYFVDYLLSSIGDRKKFYSECRCVKPGIHPSFMDNVILFAGKYLPVEVKLAVSAEPNIHTQVSKYCYNTCVYLDTDGKTITSDDMHPGKVMVIDTEDIYMYDAPSDTLNPIFELDYLRTEADLVKIKETISQS